MSAPGDAITAAMLRHRASVEASKAIAERIALERERAQAETAGLSNVPDSSAVSTSTER